MSTPAGWFVDPYGRYAQRYWDGAAWTEHVTDAEGNQQVDPMGATTVRPFFPQENAVGKPDESDQGPGGVQAFGSFATASPGAQPTGAAQIGNPFDGGLTGILERMRPTSVERPQPSLAAAVAGGAGALVPVGLAALFMGDQASKSGLTIAGILATGAGVALRLMLTGTSYLHTVLRSFAVGLGVVGIALFAGSLTSDAESLFLPFFLAAVLYLAAWLLPGFHGRTIMLGLAALSVVIAVAQLAGQNACGRDRYCDDGDAEEFFRRFSDQGFIFLILGAALLGATWYLDRRGYRGTGTAFVGSGLIATQLGVFLVASKFSDATGGLVLSALVGLLVCYVGSHGQRRATTWWGAYLAVGGVAAALIAAMKPDDASSTGTAILLGAALLIGGLLIVDAIKRGQAASSGQPAAPQPPSSWGAPSSEPPPPPSASDPGSD